MEGNRLQYRRKLSKINSWRDFSIQHAAFALHRITGWLLLVWVCVHLGFPTITSGASVWNPVVELGSSASKIVIVGLFAILLFHAFNGIRLIAAELLGVGAGSTRIVFLGTVALSGLLLVILGISL